jgi:DNA-binding NtrC family response regulator
MGHRHDDKIIHVVDDEKDIVAVVEQALRRQGYPVHAFSNSEEALKDILECREKMAILLTDMRMPGYSGFELARRARAIVPDIPVVMMTSFEIKESEFEKIFPSLKVTDFLQKPFDVKKLTDIIAKYGRQGEK